MFTRTWLLSTAERLVKTFLQGYIAFWTLTAGLGDTPAEVARADAFDTLFTIDNVKAGLVMAVLSLATSIISTPFGPDNAAPSLVVSENAPTAAR